MSTNIKIEHSKKGNFIEKGEIRMHSYECEDCGTSVEIEEYEALFGNVEPYEFGLCRECFDKSLDKKEF